MISVLFWLVLHAYQPCEPHPGRPRARWTAFDGRKRIEMEWSSW